MKTEISISTSLVGKQKCYQCNKNSYCLSVKYNNKYKEFYLCVHCCDFPFINWDRQHYIAWWMKVNLKIRKGFVNER